MFKEWFDRNEKRAEALSVTADGASATGAEQHPGELALLIQNRSAGITLPRGGGELDHFEGKIAAGRDHLGAATGLGTISPIAAIASNRQCLATLRRSAGDFDRFNRRAPNCDRRQIPIAVGFENLTFGSESAGEGDRYGARCPADDMPVGQYETVASVFVNECAGAVGRSIAKRDDDTRD